MCACVVCAMYYVGADRFVTCAIVLKQLARKIYDVLLHLN